LEHKNGKVPQHPQLVEILLANERRANVAIEDEVEEKEEENDEETATRGLRRKVATGFIMVDKSEIAKKKTERCKIRFNQNM
jgi:hypothetical protein